MKNRKIFSFGLYKEMLRQSSIFGIIVLVVSMLFASGTLFGVYYNMSPEIVYMPESMYGIKAFFGFVAPIMALLGFSYVNKRKNADFIHSLPYTRECVYLSIYAAIATWLLAAILCSTAVAVATRAVFPQYYLIIYESAVKSFLEMFVSSLLAVSAVSLACSLTGTILMNIAASVTILYAPSGFFKLLASAMSFGMIPEEYVTSILPSSYNLYVSNYSLGALLLGLEPTNYGAIIYTFLLAVIYGALACFFFKRRKSEAAHKPAVSRVWLSVFRIALSALAFMGITEGIYYTEDPIFWLFILIVVVGNFAYELVFTKKWKSIWKAIPGIIIAGAICFVSQLGVYLWTEIANKYQPAPEEIESVRIVGFDVYTGYGEFTVDIFDHSVKNASKVKISDERINKIISDSIAKTYIHRYHEPVPNGRNEIITVAVKSGLFERYRSISVDTDDYELLFSYLAENEEYKKAFMEFPETERGIVSLYSYSYRGDMIADPAAIESLGREVPTVDFKEWFDYLTGHHRTYDEFSLITKDGLNSKVVIVPVKASVLPDTFNGLKSKHLDSQYDRDVCADFFEEIERVKNGDKSDMAFESRTYEVFVHASVKTEDGVRHFNKTFLGTAYIIKEDELDDFFGENFETLTEMVSEVRDEKLELDSFVEITFTKADEYQYYDGTDTAYFNIPAEYIDFFLSWGDIDSEYKYVFTD